MADSPRMVEDPTPYNADRLQVLFPPTDEPSAQTLAGTVLLLACFTIGIAEMHRNSRCSSTQIGSRFRNLWNCHKYNKEYGNCPKLAALQYYVSILHVVYFLISIALPSVIIENLVNMWMFGMVTCASHFVLVTSGRAVIGWILVFLVLDQIFCDNWKLLNHITQRTAFFISVAFLFLFAALIVAPSLFYIKLQQVIVSEDYGAIANFRIDTYACSTTLPKNISLYANTFAVLFDFILPIVIIVAVVTVLGRRRHRRSAHYNQWKINSFIMLLTILHFLAYLPHWTAILLHFLSENWSLQFPDWLLGTLKQLVLLFPHLTAAFAWIPLSNLSTLLADRARNLCSESYHKISRQKRQAGTWAEESVF